MIVPALLQADRAHAMLSSSSRQKKCHFRFVDARQRSLEDDACASGGMRRDFFTMRDTVRDRGVTCVIVRIGIFALMIVDDIPRPKEAASYKSNRAQVKVATTIYKN